MKALYLVPLTITLAGVGSSFGQTQNYYVGFPVTGQLALTTTVNVTQLATTAAQTSQAMVKRKATRGTGFPGGLRPKEDRFKYGRDTRPADLLPPSSLLGAKLQGTPISSTTNSFGFMGLTHYEMRNANGGNQYSIEPPSQGLAVGNGFVVEGVNNAFQVYNTSGQPLLPATLATNQVFGVAPAINWATGAMGVYPTDIRVYYDQGLNSFFVMQRAQDYAANGTALNSSHLYLAVSQTGDPTGNYNVYVMNTTNASRTGCPCFPDYVEIGSDQYGIFITWDEYDTAFSDYVDAVALAISKASFASGASAPTAYQFQIPLATGYEFAIQPAFTPPGGAPFVADGGLVYFVSNLKNAYLDSNLALWAMTNTSSLNTANPNLALLETLVPIEYYEDYGIDATQEPGPTPLGGTGAQLEMLDGGDTRIQSVEYVGANLYVTMETQMYDDNGELVIGGAYIVLSPIFRANVLNASIVTQGYFYVNGNYLLRPAIAVNPQGQGAIVFTLTGPTYYPSAAFLTFNGSSVGSTVQIAGAGALPEDGFTGYEDSGVSRWGDYSAATVDSSGAIWMATEYIPNAPRTPDANWGTYIVTYAPSN